MRTVRSGFVTSASSQTVSAASSGSTGAPAAATAPAERQRTGQEVHPQVQAVAGPDEVVDLLVRLGVAERAGDLDADQVRHGQADRPADLAGEPLGDQRARTLAGPAELDHVEPVIVGLDESGQRAALTQRRHVARGDHGPHHRGSLPD